MFNPNIKNHSLNNKVKSFIKDSHSYDEDFDLSACKPKIDESYDHYSYDLCMW